MAFEVAANRNELFLGLRSCGVSPKFLVDLVRARDTERGRRAEDCPVGIVGAEGVSILNRWAV